jgi:hypothetical protein
MVSRKNPPLQNLLGHTVINQLNPNIMKIYKVYYKYELFDGDGYYSWEIESDDEFNTYHLTHQGAEAHIKMLNLNDIYRHKLHMEERIRDGYAVYDYYSSDYKIREITLEL